MTDIIITNDPAAEIRGPQIQTGIEVPGFDVSGGRPIMAMHSFFDSFDVLKAFASDVRVKVVKLLHIRCGVTVNEITAALFRLWL